MAETKNNSLEREYVIPLRSKYMHVPRYKKTPKAIKTVKEFLARHMKIRDRDLNKIKLDKALNEYLWFRGIKNPPHKVKVKATIDSQGFVRAELVDLPDKLKFKKIREEKMISQAKEAVEKKKGIMDKAKEAIKSPQSTEKSQLKESPSGEGKKEEKSGDKNKDGVEDKIETKEKEESAKESTEKMEKDLAKQAKHETKVQSPKEQKNQRVGYNKSSRGQ